MQQIIDLTVDLNAKTPVYPGDPSLKISKIASVPTDGFEEHIATMPTHIGTHIDAPSHMINRAQSFSNYELSRFIGKGCIIDIRKGIDEVTRSKPPEDSVILFYTGWSVRYNDPAYFTDYTPLTEEIGQWLVEQRPKAVGFDMSGPDYEPFPIHKILLKACIPIIENLCNFDKIYGKEFEVVALPIKLDLDGAPARVIAILD